MIWLALLSTQAAEISPVAPEEFRRNVVLHHMCVTKEATESGYKEVGLLYLQAGENLANVAVTKAGEQPPMFEKGIVTAARSEKEPQVTRLIASLEGERNGRPAQLEITLSRKAGDGLGVSLNLSESGRDLRFSCFPDIRERSK